MTWYSGCLSQKVSWDWFTELRTILHLRVLIKNTSTFMSSWWSDCDDLTLSVFQYLTDRPGASKLVTGDEFTVAFFHFCDEFTVWRLHPVTTSLWRVIRLMSTLLYISCRCAMSVSCCCVLMAYTRKPILGWFFRYYFMSHFKAEMH